MHPEEVINHLINIQNEKKLAHAYLIETNYVDRCYKDLVRLFKVINCGVQYQNNCNNCNLCHLIDENLLPSLIVIEPDGKTIKKAEIENLKNKFALKSLYTRTNIYVIKYPEKMNDTAFNKMLKFVEEPEENIIGFFITENKDYVANTIVSRCDVLKMYYKINNLHEKLNISEDDYNKYYKLANEYITNLTKTKNKIVWYNNSVLQKELKERTEVIEFIKVLSLIYEDLINKKENLNLNLKRYNIVVKYLNQLNYNINTNLALDSLGIELGELYE